MLFDGEFVSGIDLVDVCLWAFVIFFFGLIFYLRREDRREGYPLEADTTGKIEDNGVFWYAPKKTFKLPHNRGTVSVPHGKRDTRKHALARTAVWPGAPYAPTGNPLADGVGPASYAERVDLPDLTNDGRNRIVPYRTNAEYTVAKETPDPRGMAVIGADGEKAGVVADLWVDQSEAIIRYLEVSLGDSTVLLPVPFAKINGEKKRIDVHAIRADQFAGVPRLKSPDSITRLEEDKISGYFGGGKLYAMKDRVEPWL